MQDHSLGSMSRVRKKSRAFKLGGPEDLAFGAFLSHLVTMFGRRHALTQLAQCVRAHVWPAYTGTACQIVRCDGQTRVNQPDQTSVLGTRRSYSTKSVDLAASTEPVDPSLTPAPRPKLEPAKGPSRTKPKNRQRPPLPPVNEDELEEDFVRGEERDAFPVRARLRRHNESRLTKCLIGFFFADREGTCTLVFEVSRL